MTQQNLVVCECVVSVTTQMIKLKIPTEDLPWAWVLQTVHTPSMNGMGHTPGFSC